MARVKSADRFPLLTSQRNSVLGLIRLAGLEAREFYWMDADSRVTPGATVDRLVHRPTDFFYEFDFVPNSGHFGTFAPGGETHTISVNPGTWDNQLTYVRSWLQTLKRELEAPPLWEQLAAGEPLFDVPALAGADTPFRDEEVEAIHRQLGEVLAYVRRELPHGSVPAVEEQLTRLDLAAASQGRVSWAQMAVGTFVGLAWSGLIAPDQARAALGLLGEAFRRLLGL